MTAWRRFCWIEQFLRRRASHFDAHHITVIAVLAASLVLSLCLSRRCLLACLKKHKGGH
jgi:hypothetical protein